MGIITIKKTTWTIYALPLLGFIVYTFITLNAPITPSQSRLGLGGTQLRLIQLSVITPMLGIWLAAMYGAKTVYDYTKLIKGSPESQPLGLIAKGVMWLAVHLVFTTTIGALRNYLIGTDSIQALVIIQNYLAIGMQMVGYYWLFRGTEGLVVLEKAEAKVLADRLRAIVPLILFTALFTMLVFQDPSRLNPQSPGTIATFYLPDYAVLISIVFPLAVMWYLGSMAALQLGVYAKTVKGKIYVQALRRITLGVVSVVSFSILLQAFGTVGRYFTGLELAPMLVVVYTLIVLYGVGYILIAGGAKKLSKIEQV